MLKTVGFYDFKMKTVIKIATSVIRIKILNVFCVSVSFVELFSVILQWGLATMAAINKTIIIGDISQTYQGFLFFSSCKFLIRLSRICKSNLIYLILPIFFIYKRGAFVQIITAYTKTHNCDTCCNNIKYLF